MKTKNLMYILIASTCALTAVSFSLWAYMTVAKTDFEKEVEIYSNGKIVKDFHIEDLNLYPGRNKEYTINLKCKAEGNYNISLDFIETTSGGLESYIDTNIMVDSNLLYSTSLKDLYDGYDVEFERDLSIDEPVKISIDFNMDLNVDDTAQGKFTKFDVRLTIDHM